MQMIDLYRLLPVIRVRDDVFRCGNATPDASIVVKQKEACPMSGWGFDLDDVWRDFFDYLVPVHLCAQKSDEYPNAEVSGAGTASAGLPGYTAGDNTE